MEPDNARALANLAQLPQTGQLAAVGMLNDTAPPATASSLATGTLASPKQVMQSTANAEILAGAVVNLRTLPIGPSTRLFDRLAAVTPVSSITVERGTTNNSVTTPSRTKLGIVNANGVQGLARLVRERLADTEQLSVKLENRTSYKQQVTFIQFRDTHMAQAIVLSRRIPGRPGVFLNNNMDRRFDVQLVLGLDVAKSQGSIGLLPPLSRARVAPALVSMTAPNEF